MVQIDGLLFRLVVYYPQPAKPMNFHESWNFPAGVSFALKQNMYWGGFCAFLPDISGLGGGGGGGPNPCKNQQI